MGHEVVPDDSFWHRCGCSCWCGARACRCIGVYRHARGCGHCKWPDVDHHRDMVGEPTSDQSRDVAATARTRSSQMVDDQWRHVGASRHKSHRLLALVCRANLRLCVRHMAGRHRCLRDVCRRTVVHHRRSRLANSNAGQLAVNNGSRAATASAREERLPASGDCCRVAFHRRLRILIERRSPTAGG